MNKLLTAKELATLLGISPQTIYNRRHLHAPLPPSVHIGRLVRFPLAEVEAWVASQADLPMPIDEFGAGAA